MSLYTTSTIDFHFRWMRPTLEVVGMSSGFTGEGVKAVIPRAATAKLSCRLVPGQQPQDIYRKVMWSMCAGTMEWDWCGRMVEWDW